MAGTTIPALRSRPKAGNSRPSRSSPRDRLGVTDLVRLAYIKGYQLLKSYMGVMKLHFRHPIWCPLWCPCFELDSLLKNRDQFGFSLRAGNTSNVAAQKAGRNEIVIVMVLLKHIESPPAPKRNWRSSRRYNHKT